MLCTLRSIISNVFFEDSIINKDYLLDISSKIQQLIIFKKSPDMVVVLLIFLKVKIPSTTVVLLAPKKVQIWLMPCCHLKKFINGFYLAGTLKSLYMVDVLLASKKKKPRYSCCPADILKSKKSRHGCCLTGIFIKYDSCPIKYLVFH